MADVQIINEQNCRAMADSWPCAVLVVSGRLGSIRYWNQHTILLLSYSPSQFPKLSLNGIFDQPDVDIIKRQYENTLETQFGFNVQDIEINDRHGRTLTVDAIGMRAIWQNKPAVMVVIQRTEVRKKLEGFVNTQASVLESLGECVTVTDLSGTIFFISESWLKSIGVSKEAFIRHNGTEFFLSHLRDRNPDIVKLLLSGRSWQGEVAIRHPGGMEMCGWLHISPIFVGTGEIIGAIAITVDIRDRKKLEEQLQTQNGLLDGLMEGIATDANGLINYVGPKATRLTGWRKEDLLGHHVFEKFPPEFQEKANEMRSLFLEKRSFSGDCPIICADGSVKTFWVLLKPVVDDGGHIISIVGITLDSKERQEADAKFFSGTKRDVKQKDYLKQNTTDYLKEIQSRFEIVKQELGKLDMALSAGKNSVSMRDHYIEEKSNFTDKKSKLSNRSSEKRLEVYCLGMLKVRFGDKDLGHWPSRRAKSLFEYLIIKPLTPVSKDVLMELFWPDLKPEAAANNVRLAAHSLKQTLNNLLGCGENFQSIIFSNGGYFINPEIILAIDADAFDQELITGRRFEKEGKISEAIREYEKAEEMYLGDYLENELYTDWTIGRREALKDSYLLVVNKLADYMMSNLDYESCITYCQKIIARDNCREDTYRKLMICHSRLGQRKRALEWYQTCLGNIENQLNSPLEKNTIALFNRLSAGEGI
jgi:PAS domain S-box-containing protein